ncbi:MAG: deoxyhypusine synthase [Candidatus Hydrothermarchaeota archaeon]|nr:deoxyhypusine synthase [Candidatus Hydrothermarchaeota archaeon]
MAKKSEYLSYPTEPVDVRRRSISELLKAMKDTGFQGRKLGEAVDAWVNMLRENEFTILMGLSGAMVPAGMGKIIAYLIRKKLIDCLVSTGANIFHDIHEALGGAHYKGNATVNDAELYKHRIDRMHDVFAPDDEFRKVDLFIAEVAESLEHTRTYSSREIIHHLGKAVAERGDREDSIIVSAYKAGVPIFLPALGDSSIGIGLIVARRRGYNIAVDQMKDIDEITQIVEKAGKTGVIYVGGGVPKNFIQQTEVITSLLGSESGGHDYGIQFTTDAPHFGGLSGCTFEEAVSWGKISPTARKVQVFVDATIALPLVTHALMERVEGLERNAPSYGWNTDKLMMHYKRLPL